MHGKYMRETLTQLFLAEVKTRTKWQNVPRVLHTENKIYGLTYIHITYISICVCIYIFFKKQLLSKLPEIYYVFL